MNDNSLTHNKPIFRTMIMALGYPFLALLLDSVWDVKKIPTIYMVFFIFHIIMVGV